MTLAGLLAPAAVDAATLRRRHGPLLEIVRKLIGVVPNCDPYLEIWPTGFRSYNLLVPNLLDLPSLLFTRGPRRQTIGLAMYAASRAARCAYCSAHCCSFALRRGTAAEKVAHATDGAAGTFAPEEVALLAVAEGLGRVPGEVTQAQRHELARRFAPADAEWLVLAIALMGFLNKVMDGLGVELEGATLAEITGVLAPSGWAPGQHLAAGSAAPAPGPAPGPDGLATKLGIVPPLPSVLLRDRRWTAGVPGAWPAVGAYLRAHAGHDFPVLAHLTHARAVRAIATVLRDNTDPAQSVLGLRAKHRAGVVYAEVVGDEDLARALQPLAGAEAPAPNDDVLAVARAAAPSPAQVTPAIVERAARLPAAAVVELMVWLGALQLVHRLNGFYA